MFCRAASLEKRVRLVWKMLSEITRNKTHSISQRQHCFLSGGAVSTTPQRPSPNLCLDRRPSTIIGNWRESFNEHILFNSNQAESVQTYLIRIVNHDHFSSLPGNNRFLNRIVNHYGFYGQMALKKDWFSILNCRWSWRAGIGSLKGSYEWPNDHPDVPHAWLKFRKNLVWGQESYDTDHTQLKQLKEVEVINIHHNFRINRICQRGKVREICPTFILEIWIDFAGRCHKCMRQ
jgi:hypothetical protein